VANESGANFYSIAGPEIMSMWYGKSEENLRKIFEDAEKNAPSIIFLDEIDSIAPKREEVHGEVERRVVSQLLTLMDGLKARGKVIVIAATNVPNLIDPALRRPGRFDREIEIGIPDMKGRKEILQIHMRHMPLAKDVDLDKIAEITYGYTGADVSALTKEAAMHALRRLLPKIKWKEEVTLPSEVLEKLNVTKEDFDYAMRIVEPSAMREVLIEVPNVPWSEIGGLEEVKEHLKESVEWPLTMPDIFNRMGITPPRGVLLYGPPGCGKTLLAKAVATESKANFISIKGPELMSKWVGESEKKVRELFRRAKQVAPTIIFFDEIDALVPRRGMSYGEHVTEKIVSQMLTELSGLEELHDVIVLAATNRPDMLDTALLRPGRFDRQILVPEPDEGARLKILEIKTKDMPLKGVNLKTLVKKTEDFSGADLEALCREAAMQALRENKKAKEVTMKHFDMALKDMSPSLSKPVIDFYRQFDERSRKKMIEGSKSEEKELTYVG
jgi:transitional endoplasmic reticulum ATPase